MIGTLLQMPKSVTPASTKIAMENAMPMERKPATMTRYFSTGVYK
jgi:hypothetical protein